MESERSATGPRRCGDENMHPTGFRDENEANVEQAAERWQGAPIGIDQCKESSQREQLMNRLRRSNNEGEMVSRALRILEAHPEFEDLIWLLRSGVI